MENEISSTMHLITSQQEIGTAYVTDDVFYMIIGLTAADIEGVSSLADYSTGEAVSKWNLRSLSKGMRLSFEENKVSVNLCLTIEFGFTIPEVASAVQEKVSDVIIHMIGYEVGSVNVRVSGIAMK